MASQKDLTRQKLLNWVNINVNGQYKSVKDLCSGVAYCQIIAKLSPGSIDMKEVIVSAKQQHEYEHNLNLLQAAIKYLESKKNIPVESLSMAGFRENFEFLKWFKKFYDSPQLRRLAHRKYVEHVKASYLRLVQKLQRANEKLRNVMQNSDDVDSGADDL